ncbi:MAG: tetratricopeptide repeat protein [candidate division Zixibacteria bacterium]|nr:tetratricopeptide repeat protein [candidate division Zixibacteria bacterium]
MTDFFRRFWPIFPALALYIFFSATLWFIQDDAYITYRYAANFLNGDGLVFNIGERVEGITNFGWAVWLILLGSVKLDYILLSQVCGLLFGAGVIVLTYRIALVVFEKNGEWFGFVAAMLVGANQSLAYWSPAGLETAAFACFAMLSLYWFLNRNHLLIWSLLLAVWLRPEGAVLTGLFILIEAIIERRVPLFSLRCAAAAFVLSLPFVGFKLGYYGSILPNPFFAKTSADIAHFKSGLAYAVTFFKDYAFFGFGLLTLLFFFKRWTPAIKTLWLFVIFYILYIIAVGGDVLKVHRFFLPLFGPAAILVAAVGWFLWGSLKKRRVALVAIAFAVPLVAITIVMPRKTVADYNNSEKLFTKKQLFIANEMKTTDKTNFSVAVSTIGIFGYALLGHEIIDMLGLTDSTIARYSEEPMKGMSTSWREQKHNSAYLLGREPTYIVFSTGVKPSAPAERAIMLYRQFTDSYRMIGWFYESHPELPKAASGTVVTAFKKTKPFVGELVPYYPVEYVQYLKTGLDKYVRGDHRTAIAYYDSSLSVSPKPYYLYTLYFKAFSYLMLNDLNNALPLLEYVVAQDSTIYEAHKDLNIIRRLLNEPERAEIHHRWLEKLVPWYLPRLDQIADEMVKKQGGSRR